MRCGRPISLKLLATALALLAGVASLAQEGGLFGPRRDAAAQSEDLWAIRCLSLQAADRMRRIETYAESLRKAPGLNAKLVLVVHGDEESAVYYGRYQRVFNSATNNPEYKPDPAKTLQLIRSLSVSNSTLPAGDPSNWPFRFASVAQLPTGEALHPEWNLENASGYWSLHVAVFYNVDQMRERKRAALEYCKLLRDQGAEAYFHHGEDKSSVCVGVFGKDAVVEVQETDPLTGNSKVSYKLAEPKIAALQKQYPESLENGYRVSQRRLDPNAPGGVKKTPTPSFIVRLPKAARDRADGLGQGGG